MTTPDGEDLVSATLYVREDLPRPARERAGAVRSTLRALASDDALATVECTRWPNRVPIDGCDRDVRDVYLEFTAWAREREASLAPFFAIRQCYSPEAGSHTDWLVVPAFAMAVHADGDLVAVYPHKRGSETVTVEDGIAGLRSLSPAGSSTDREPSDGDLVYATGSKR